MDQPSTADLASESIIHVRSCTNRTLLTNHEHGYQAQGLRALAGFGEARLTGTYGYVNLTHRERCLPMRTNIEIDDQLMLEAMRSGLARTKRATVEAGLGLSFRFEGKRQSDVYLAR